MLSRETPALLRYASKKLWMQVAAPRVASTTKPVISRRFEDMKSTLQYKECPRSVKAARKPTHLERNWSSRDLALAARLDLRPCARAGLRCHLDVQLAVIERRQIDGP